MCARNIHWVECKCVNRSDVIYILDVLFVVLERVFLLLSLRTWIEILYAGTALHGPNRVT